MGERRSQFQNEYNANKKVILEKLNKEAPDNSITKRKEVKDTWKNESITRAGWKSDEVKDARRPRDGERREWSERQNRRPMSDESQYNMRRSSFSRDRDGNDGRWRNDNYNNKERRSDRPFEDRRRDSFGDRNNDNNRSWRNYNNNQRERQSDRPFEDRKREPFRDRDDGNNRNWRNDSSNQRERRSDRPFEDRRRESFRDRDNGNNRNWRSDKYNQRGRRNSRKDSFFDDKRRNEPFRANDRHRENGSRDGKERED